MNNYNSLISISPIDGRYRKTTENLSEYFSEYALIKFRILIEVEYFISLCEIPLPELNDFDSDNYIKLRELYSNFTTKSASRIKEIEATTNHDIKAVEYYLKEQFDALGLSKYKEFIHFGLTSQDINNTAIPLSLKLGFEDVIFPAIIEVVNKLKELSKEWQDIAMLAHTHGQPASPTRLGKEIDVFIERLDNQVEYFQYIPCSGKFGGATGNFNAHLVAYPEIDWNKFSDIFVNSLGLKRLQTTTQIEHYDNLAAFCDNLKRINNILIDLDRDMWTYISMSYFKQKIKAGEVGSSAMPHKVNPIDFENSEGNLGVANAILEHLSAKLPISRMQRDLTDSTVLRNIGVPLAHILISLKSTLKGLNKLELNVDKINSDLENNWAVVAEAIQTILRKINYPNPYEALKELTRTNSKITKASMEQFIDSLEISDELKIKMKAITPYTYTGIKKQ